MATQTLKLNVKSGEKDGKNFWDRCGVLFVNTDDSGNITSINVKHSMFPDVEMVAFPCSTSSQIWLSWVLAVVVRVSVIPGHAFR